MKRTQLVAPLASSLLAGTLLAQAGPTVTQPLVATPGLAHDPAALAALDPGMRYLPGAIVLELQPELRHLLPEVGAVEGARLGVAAFDDLADAIDARVLETMYPYAARNARERGLPDLSGWVRIRFNPELADPEDAAEAFAALATVARAEPIGVHMITATPNDGNYSSQWHLNQSTDKDIDAPEGWDIGTGGPGITVAVLDTGVRYYHKDLGGGNASSSNPTATDGNIWINLAEKNGIAGVDDDGNGYVDDWVGYDFVATTSSCWSGEDCGTIDNDPRDFNGHGTHCAGIVSSINNNGYATASAAGGWGNGTLQATANGTKVMCLRMGYAGTYLGQQVGYVLMDAAANSFYYAANNGAQIASCSWGSSNSGGIAAAIDYFIASGGLIFVAAGNSGNQSASYVASRSDCYAVAATSQTDAKASFSNYGTWVDISAPGVAILSTYHSYSAPASDYVASLDGTSMACPMVASVAAAVWAKNPTWTRTQVWAQVRDTTDNIGAQNPSYSGLLGSGRINLFNALNGAPPPPPPPPTWGPGTMLMVFTDGTSIPTVGTVQNEDIVAYDPSTGAWSLYFDGSDVGISSLAIGGLHRNSDGTLLISFSAAGTVTGLTGGPNGTSVDDSDIVRFTPTSLGSTTAGTWSFHFDGSDVGLTTDAEGIDAIAAATDGNLVISTVGNPSVTGLSSLGDEDLIKFIATSLGSVTAGTWAYHVDGSDISLSNTGENIDACNILSTGLHTFSTSGNYSVPGASGANEDLFDFAPTALGATTSGSFSAFFDGSGAGLSTGTNLIAYAEIE